THAMLILCIPLSRLPLRIPYTPLFRSDTEFFRDLRWAEPSLQSQPHGALHQPRSRLVRHRRRPLDRQPSPPCLQRKLAARLRLRSEEHTSELQSRENLVCRLLLEKKKG